jgi:hypothetical protein
MPDPSKKAEFRRAAEIYGRSSVLLSDQSSYAAEADIEMRRLGSVFTGDRQAMDNEVKKNMKFCGDLGQEHTALIAQRSKELQRKSNDQAR